MNDTLDNNLEQKRPTLSEEEKVLMLQNVTKRAVAPVVSPYLQFVRGRVMVPLAAIVVMMVATGTVAASESAKPGDLLFPIDRASEEVLIALASESKEASLRAKFNDERLFELRGIISEEKTTAEDVLVVDAEGEVRISKAVAEILNYAKRSRNHEEKESFLKALVTMIDGVEVEGRRKEKDDDNSDESRDESRLRIDDDRIEVREDGYRIRIDDDGEVRIKRDDDFQEGGRHDGDDSIDDWSEDDQAEDNQRGDNNLDDGNDDDYEDYEDDEWEDGDDSSGDEEDEWEDEDDAEPLSGEVSISEFEVKMKEEETEVHIKYDGKEIEYKTSANTIEEIVAEAANKTGLSEVDLEVAMDIEVDN